MTLDEIIQKRKTIRNFTDEEVTKEQMEMVIEAGRQAAFAGMTQAGTTDFRRFFVIKKGSKTAEKLMELVWNARKEDLKELEALHLDEKYPVYANAVKNMSSKPPMDLFMAPYLIVVAERGGRPAREEATLGYIFSNMWMKATEMGLGLKLCSGVSDVKDKKSLKELFGLPVDDIYAFDGCNLGYAADSLYREGIRMIPEQSITYME